MGDPPHSSSASTWLRRPFTRQVDQDAASQSAAREIAALNSRLLTLESENETLRHSNAETEGSQRILHKVILQSALADTDPSDGDVKSNFGELDSAIFQFVRKHCKNYGLVDDPVYQALASEAKNRYVMHLISDCIYDGLFAPGTEMFGFGAELDDMLRKFESALIKAKMVPDAEIVAWRARTCLLSEFRTQNSDGQTQYPETETLVTQLMGVLKPFWQHNSAELEAMSDDIKAGLSNICTIAADIVIGIRRSKTAYLWLQKHRSTVRSLTDDDVEEVATAGFETFADAGDDFKTVFGEVLKVDNALNPTAEGSLVVRKALVLLGPFQSSGTDASLPEGCTVEVKAVE